MRCRLGFLLVTLAAILIGWTKTPDRSPALDVVEELESRHFLTPTILLDRPCDSTALNPQYEDFDQDGKNDLLLGHRDRLLVSRNRGTDRDPLFHPPIWFDDLNPTGRIPSG